MRRCAGWWCVTARLAGALVEAAEQISGVTGALAAVSNTGCDRGDAGGAGRRGGGRAARRSCSSIWPAAPASSPCSSGSARAPRRQGRHRRQSRHAGGLRLPPLARRPTRPPRGRPSRPGPRRSGFPDADRALPGGRPADPRPGGDGLGTAARRRADRAGGRPGRRRAPGSRISTGWRCTPEIEVEFATVAEAAAAAARLAGRRARGRCVLTGDLETMAALHARRPAVTCTGSTSAASTTGRAGASGCRTCT